MKDKFSKFKITNKIITIFLIFSSVWIFTSDRLIYFLIKNPETLNKFQTYKGLIFVVVTAIILYYAINSAISNIIKQHNALVDSEAFYSSIYNNNHLNLLVVNPKTGEIKDANPGALNFYGYSIEEICSMNINQINTMTTDEIHKEMERAVSENNSFFIFEHKLCNGIIKTVQVISGPIIVNNQKLLFSMITDISDEIQSKLDLQDSQEKIRQLAYHDFHTGLLNKNYLVDKVNNLIGASQPLKIAILFFSINNLDQTTELMGTDFITKLCVIIEKRVSTLLKNKESIVQYNKNEFIIQLVDYKTDSSFNTRYENIINKLNTPYEIDGFELNISTNAGVSIYPNNSDNIDELIYQSNVAMKMSKFNMSNSIVEFDNKIEKTLIEQMELENDLKKAIKNDSLHLYYQPIVASDTNKTVKAEALLRWIHPSKGFISPAIFIPIAEKSNLILALGEWVIRESFKQIKNWLDDGVTPPVISINISAKQLEQKDFVQMVKALITEVKIDTKYIEFELTESLAVGETSSTINALNGIKELGISISIDDFGTGYSSLSLIKKLPLSTLKIDMNFVSDINKSTDGTIIVATIIAMAKSMNLIVIAEGVETLEQFNFLKDLHCDMIQGYLISKPVPINTFSNILNKVYDIHS